MLYSISGLPPERALVFWRPNWGLERRCLCQAAGRVCSAAAVQSTLCGSPSSVRARFLFGSSPLSFSLVRPYIYVLEQAAAKGLSPLYNVLVQYREPP
jgi:hypothetical protein